MTPIFLGLATASALLLKISRGRSLDTPIFLAFATYAIAMGAFLLTSKYPQRARGPLAIGSSHIYHRKRPLLPRDAIRSALVVPRDGAKNVVRIEQGGLAHPIEVTLPNDEDARAFLHALGLGATQKVVRFWLGSRLIPSRLMGAFWVCAYVVLLTFTSRLLLRAHAMLPVGLMPLLVVLVAAVTAIPVLWPTRLTVGADGLLVHWLTGSELVPYGALETVHGFDFGVELELRSGRRIRLMLPSRRNSHGGHDRERRDLIVERIREAADAYERGGGTVDPALLVRGGRDGRSWIRALRALGSGGSVDHRTAPVSREGLFRVVEDPSAKPAARAAAAIALSSTLSEEERPRLRSVANATASRKVRVLLEAVAQGDDDDALEQAAEALEAGD